MHKNCIIITIESIIFCDSPSSRISTGNLQRLENLFLSGNHEQELHKGDYLWYNNKEYKAMFQDDGNFMIYSWKPVWNSDTAGQDENVVGHTNTHRLDGGQMCRLSLRNDGTVVIERVLRTFQGSPKCRGAIYWKQNQARWPKTSEGK
uniref:Uncharacterized protein n=1 Tax=Denticeps clupeoides TaxID=299321 RepID=A0AAY4DX37_9TELE